jgi:hypothetical protein
MAEDKTITIEGGKFGESFKITDDGKILIDNAKAVEALTAAKPLDDKKTPDAWRITIYGS